MADLIRDTFKRGKYQDVIPPLTVLRRLDCVLAPTKAKVLETVGKLKARGLQNLDPQLKRASGFAFYNTSRYDFDMGSTHQTIYMPDVGRFVTPVPPFTEQDAIAAHGLGATSVGHNPLDPKGGQ